MLQAFWLNEQKNEVSEFEMLPNFWLDKQKEEKKEENGLGFQMIIVKLSNCIFPDGPEGGGVYSYFSLPIYATKSRIPIWNTEFMPWQS